MEEHLIASMSTRGNILFFGVVTDDAKIFLDRQLEWKTKLQNLKGSKIQMTIEKRKSKRSYKQNNYLWGAVYQTISLETGHTPEELHHIFGQMFLQEPIVFNGKEIMRTKSTSDLSKGEMVEYVMNISAEVGNMGITLPDPDDWDPSKLL